MAGSVITIVFSGDGGDCGGDGFAAAPFYIAIDKRGDIYTLAPWTSVVGDAPELDLVSDGGLTALITADQQPTMDGMTVAQDGTIFLSIESPEGFDQIFTVMGSNILIFAGQVGGCGDTGSDAGAGVDAVGGMVGDSIGDLYMAESHGNCNKIRKIAPDGTITTISGQGPEGFEDGPGQDAEFTNPEGIAQADGGLFYVVDEGNNVIRTVAQDGTTATIAGDPYSPPGFMDGLAEFARFDGPNGIALVSGGDVYVADVQNNRVRVLDSDGNVSTLAGNGTRGFADGTLGPDGGAEFNRPEGIAVDAQGNLWVADTFNCALRKIILPQ